MRRQFIRLSISIATAALCLSAAVSETPKECMKETPDYSETLCREKCKEEAFKSQPYCSSFLPTEIPPLNLSTASVTVTDLPIPHPSNESIIAGSGNSTSSAVAFQSSLAISASCFLLSYYL